MERRILRNLTERARRIEEERLKKIQETVQAKFHIQCDINGAKRTLNSVLIPTSANAVPDSLFQINEAIRALGAKAVPMVSENRLYLSVERRNAPSDRAVGILLVLLGAIIVVASHRLSLTWFM